jgi:hypothetical protein
METDSSTKKDSPHRYIKFIWYQVCHSALDTESQTLFEMLKQLQHDNKGHFLVNDE